MDSVSKSDIDKNWSKILKDSRLKANLTQEQLAEKIGISVKYISRIETGKSGIKTQTLIKYINLLGITPNVFYKSFVDNSEIMSNIRLSEKIETLSEDKKEFISNVIDELKHIK
ncbi:MAG: helix-turn-helix domain-containing protein [Clostridiales bacterium]|nr:helix-turn-helix domain-containing protein [Clostridiales bacterium]